MKELFIKGGILMYPLLILSIIGLTVSFERIIYFFTIEKCDYEKLKNELVKLIKKDDIEGAITLCGKYENSVARVLEAVIKSYAEEEERIMMEERVREIALGQIPVLERFMWILGLTGSISPLVGLLGTVIGMIQAFNNIASQGFGRPELLAGGIYTALITTATGLTIAIPAVIIYNYLNKKIDWIINEMEKASVEFINAIGG